ncbi:hypothetical protein Pcac1_g22723 [Phytophthora cactorum]|nr:hypothetical protein Pcac1_g22723 [Phytophthora cactorum]KAG2837303.1 hypothetical protein PC111_g4706 [Phytophthora cactorum]KAG2844101.1 hypothetical protein PC112_g2374 [Phytophthora cactorum]KAG2930067.1 hypothetical protein PC114_g2598 [Phytophthora cactorum]
MGINYVSVGSHYVNGTQGGEEIKVFKPSKFTLVKVANTDSEFQEGMSTTSMGWGITTCEEGDYSLELRGVAMEAWDSKNCSEIYIDHPPSQLCVGGVAGEGTAPGDMGAPLIKEN